MGRNRHLPHLRLEDLVRKGGRTYVGECCQSSLERVNQVDQTAETSAFVAVVAGVVALAVLAFAVNPAIVVAAAVEHCLNLGEDYIRQLIVVVAFAAVVAVVVAVVVAAAAAAAAAAAVVVVVVTLN